MYPKMAACIGKDNEKLGCCCRLYELRLYELSQQMEKAQQDMEDFQNQVVELGRIKEQVVEAYVLVKEQEWLFLKYNSDLKRLQKVSAIQNFVCHALCNNGLTREERIATVAIQKEQSESKLKVSNQKLMRLKIRLSDLKKAPERLATASDTYDRLFAEKTDLLLEFGAESIQESLQTSRQRGNQLKHTIALLQDTNDTGKLALARLSTVLGHLDGAANWGSYSLMGGGGTMVTMMKRNQIGHAQTATQAAQHSMKKFNSKLSHLSRTLQYNLDDMNGVSHFCDYAMDGLLINWHVQSQINTARHTCRGAIDQVRRQLRETETQLQLAQREQTTCQQRVKSLVLSDGVEEANATLCR